MTMDRQEFKEMMMEAREAEEETIAEKVELAIKNDTGKEITKLVEEKPKRKCTKRKTQSAPSWQRYIEDCISLMLKEGEEKVAQADKLMDEATELLEYISELEGIIG